MNIHDEYNACRVDKRYMDFMRGPFIYLKFVTYCLLPFLIILVLNILIVARLRWTPQTLKPGMLGSSPGVSIGLDASTVVMTDGRGTTSSSTVRIANTPSTSASSSSIALRQRQQVRQSVTSCQGGGGAGATTSTKCKPVGKFSSKNAKFRAGNLPFLGI